MEGLAAGGSTSALRADTIIPGVERKQDGDWERKEVEQGRCGSGWNCAEATAAIGGGVRMDTLQEQMGKTTINRSWSLGSWFFFAFKLLCYLNIACCAHTEICHVCFQLSAFFFLNTPKTVKCNKTNSFVSSTALMGLLKGLCWNPLWAEKQITYWLK